MRILKWASIFLGGLVLLAGLAGFAMPSKVTVSRGISIAAAPGAIFPLIADFKNGWSRWNTFDDNDTDIKYTYEGPDAGVGAVQAWTSKRMGDGRMTLTQADSASGIQLELSMRRNAFQLLGKLEMSPEGSATHLAWTDEMEMGKNPFRRLMGPMIGKMIGKSFESSLANIKGLAEKAATPPAETAPSAPVM